MNEAADETVWQMVIEYGPQRVEIGSVQLRATEEVADEATRALLADMQRALREAIAPHGCSIRMASVSRLTAR